MTWRSPTARTATAAVVPAGIVLAVMMAWLVTDLHSADALTLSAVEVEQQAAPVVTAQVDPIALEQGRVYFAQLCVSCHGARGDGLGEWAYRVVPRPANLTSARTRKRSDAQLYEIISEGLPGTAMIGWKRQLSEGQRQQIVAYVRHLGGGAGGDTRE